MSQVFGDHRRYNQILLNFLSNSIKFTPSGKQVQVIVTVLEVQQMHTDDIDEIKSEVFSIEQAHQKRGKILRNIADKMSSSNYQESKDLSSQDCECSVSFSIEIRD